MASLLLENAKIATSTEVFDGTLWAENGKIAAIARNNAPIEGVPADTQRINLHGNYLLPGGVDPHTHFDLDNGFTRTSDNFYTGSVAAACGGTTTIIDHMAFGPAGCRLEHQAGVYHGLAQAAVIDYGFHGVIQHVDADVLEAMQTLRDSEGITSYKIYLTYDYRLHNNDIIQVLARAKELGLTICAHCENDAVIAALKERLRAEGKTQPRWHPVSRPAEAEAEAVFRILMLARVAGEAKVYIVHLSSQLGLDTVRLARTQGQQNIFAETCPQYMFLTDDLYNDDHEGLKYIMSPPLRKSADNAALWHGLEDGTLNTIGTDHCSFFFATQKQRGAQDFTKAPGGAPGVELRMPLLFSEGFLAGRLSLPQMVQLCCTHPAQIFGIAPRKGDICVGADADFVVFNPNEEYTVTKAMLHENVDYTPYEGMRLRGKPVMTFSRGELIVQNGVFTGAEGRGQYLKRGI